MRIDGHSIAKELYEEIAASVRTLPCVPVLGIITCAPNFETRSYLALKERKAALVGINTKVIELSMSAETDDILQEIAQLDTEGIVVQLPLPSHIDREVVLATVPPDKDVDALNPQTSYVHSPVVEACKEILDRSGVVCGGKKAVVLGDGQLVGAPVATWLRDEGAQVIVCRRDADDIASVTRTADIIVSGMGVPGFLTPDMIQEGVVLLDAGTSEAGGRLAGDANPACEQKAALFTPVPGGIGPITVAALLRNLVRLAVR